MIENAPANLTVVIISRSDPPIPLARYRAGGLLSEVRASDLRFSSEEIDRFYQQTLDISLDESHLRALEFRTEGWIAGLQMAGLSLRGQTDVDAFIRNFAGDNRYIMDYLVEEVLGKRSGKIRRFLLQTSILDQLCGPLCDFILDGSDRSDPAEIQNTDPEFQDSQEILEYLESENLFISAVDSKRKWFRYHHLFGDILKFYLMSKDLQDSISQLHGRAAQWFEREGNVHSAVKHCLAAKNIHEALRLIEQSAWSLIQQGESVTLQTWLSKIPEPFILERPRLCLMFAWALTFLGRIEEYEKYICRAEEIWRQTNDPQIGEVLNLKADMALARHQREDADILIQEALRIIPEDDFYNRGLSYLYLGTSKFIIGDGSGGIEALTRAKDLCQRSNNIYGYSSACNSLSQIMLSHGRLHDVYDQCQEVFEVTRQVPVFGCLVAHMLLGSVLREWNRLDEAEENVQYALEGSENAAFDIFGTGGYLILSLIMLSSKSYDKAWQLLDRAEQRAIRLKNDVVVKMIHAVRARVDIASGDVKSAEAWVRRYWVDPKKSDINLEEEAFIAAYIHYRIGEYEEAIRIIDGFQPKIEKQSRNGTLVEVYALRALIHHGQNQPGNAVECIMKAVELAEPGEYLRIFLDEEAPMLDILKQAVRVYPGSAYLKKVIQAFPGPDQTNPAVTSTVISEQPWNEPLTPREIEILQLLNQGLSNKEIAARLFISLHTVKVHLKHLYGKLDAGSRTQAIAIARSRGYF